MLINTYIDDIKYIISAIWKSLNSTKKKHSFKMHTTSKFHKTHS